MVRLLAYYDTVSDAKHGFRRLGTTWEERIEINLRELDALGADTARVREQVQRAKTKQGKVGVTAMALNAARGLRSGRPLEHEWRCRGKAKSNGGERCQRIVEQWIREEGVHYCRLHGGAWSASGLKAQRQNR